MPAPGLGLWGVFWLALPFAVIIGVALFFRL
jgi:hypothetical protein